MSTSDVCFPPIADISRFRHPGSAGASIGWGVMALQSVLLAATIVAQISQGPVPAPPPNVPPLTLTCTGEGTANKLHSSSIYADGRWGTITSRHDRQFSDQVDLRLFNGDDRIRLPRTMLPAAHGGDEGWFRLKDVEADARSIRAEAQVNFINHPKVYIDRVTGTISISGKAGDYHGECQVIDASAPPKF